MPQNAMHSRHRSSATFTAVALAALAVLLSTNKTEGSLMSLKLYIEEESPPEKFIGDLRKELTSNFDPQVLSKVETFTFLPRPFQKLDSFRIDASSVIRTTSVPLDREAYCFQNFIPSLVVDNYESDVGQRLSPMRSTLEEECIVEVDVGLGNKTNFAAVVVTVKIVVIDVNDNPPTFSQDIFHLSFLENSPPGVKIVLPLAIDRDTQRFGVKGYRLQGQSTRLFELHLEKEAHTIVPYLVVLHKLRYFVEPYLLTLEAFDGGTPQMTGSVTLSIAIEDENDHSPQFAATRQTITLREDQALNTVVYIANATDADHGVNAEVQYSLGAPSRNVHYPNHGQHQDGASPLRIDRHTGRVYLRRTLDYESEKWHQVTIVAVDQGRQPQTGQMVLEVKVEDINDNPPMIKLNTIGPSSSSRQKNPDDPHRVEVEENTPPGSFVAHVSVFDVDTGAGGHVRCRQESQEKNFRLNDLTSGQHTLTTLMNPDHESIKSYLIRIVCFDQGHPSLTSELEILVTVVDLNDNAPVFTEKSYNVSVAENNIPDAYVLQVRATDRDSGNNSRLIYSILESSISSRIFSIHPETGVIKSTVVLDHETNKSISFTVRASDCGQPALQTDAKVTVVIQDVNDQEPSFLDPPYDFDIRENNQPGSLVGFVSAVDGDSPPYNQFIYKLIPSSSSSSSSSADEGDSSSTDSDMDSLSSFSIDPKSGKIMAKTALDREERSKFNFVIAAVDQDRPTLSSTAEVCVRILDENDNRPKIRLHNTSKNTDYSSAEGHELLATPPQRSHHHQHHYQQHNHHNHHHHHHQHQQQQNQNDPSEEIVELSSFHISTFVPVGYTVATFSATDADEGANAEITFTMVVLDLHDSLFYPAMSSYHHTPMTPSPPSQSPQTISEEGGKLPSATPKAQAFLIDQVTGRLSTGMDFSSYNIRRYRLLITAQDGGDPPSSSTLRMTVVVDPSLLYYDEDYGGTRGFLRNLATRHGSVLVLGVIAISTVIGLLLIIAIVAVKLRDRRGIGHLRHTDAYHCRVQEQKAMEKANGYGPAGGKSAFRQLADEDKSLSLNQELNNRSCISPNSNNTFSTQSTLNKRNMLNSQNSNNRGESVISRQKVFNNTHSSGSVERNCVKESLNSLTDESNDSGLPASFEDTTLKKNGVSWKLVDLRNDSNDTLDRGSSGVNSPTYCRTYYHHAPQPLTSNFTCELSNKSLTVEVAPLKPSPESGVQNLPPPPASMLLSIDEIECQCQRSGEIIGCYDENCRIQQHYLQQQLQQQQRNKWNCQQRFVVDPSPPQCNDYNKQQLLPSSSSFYEDQETLPLRNAQLKELNFYVKGQATTEEQRQAQFRQPVAQVKPQMQQKFATFLGSSPTKQGRETLSSAGLAEDYGCPEGQTSGPQTPSYKGVKDGLFQEAKVISILPAHNSALMEKLKQNNLAKQHQSVINNRA